MSSLLQPVGPEPPGVYWRRRLAVLLVIAIILFGIWWLLRGGSGGSGTPAAASSSGTASATASGDATATPSDSPSGTATRSPSPSKSATGTASPSASVTEGGECPDSVIEVEASTGKATYRLGTPVKLTLTITNGGNVACTRDVGSKANELKISSGGYHVWSSDDCNPGGTSDVATLQPGEAYVVTINWDGRLSGPGCPSGLGSAKAGSYDLVGRNGDVESQPSGFVLS